MAGAALLAAVSRTAGIVLLAAAVALVVLGITLRRKGPGARKRRSGTLSARSYGLPSWRQASRPSNARSRTSKKRAGATHLLTEALAACRRTAPTPEAAAAALEQWLTSHQGHVGQLGSAQSQWAELQALLNGRTSLQLRDEADRTARQARVIVTAADPALLAAITPATAAGKLADLRETAPQAWQNSSECIR